MTRIPERSDHLLTVKQVAERLATSEKTVRRLIDAGELPTIRFGRNLRITPVDVDRFIASHRCG